MLKPRPGPTSLPSSRQAVEQLLRGDLALENIVAAKKVNPMMTMMMTSKKVILTMTMMMTAKKVDPREDVVVVNRDGKNIRESYKPGVLFGDPRSGK